MNLSILTSLGLSEKAAKIYLATLSLGVATVQDIALKAEIKRPTAYIHIEELFREGLLEKYPSGKKEFFKAADPIRLEKRAERQLKEVHELVPELHTIQQQMTGRPHVSILEGRKALDLIYRELQEANQIRFWSDLAAVEKNFSDKFIEIAEAVNKNEIRCREIIADTPEAKKSSKHYATIAGKTYSSRLATKPSGIWNDNSIYDDVVAMFRIQGYNLFVIRIEEPVIANTMKTLFDMAWDSGTPFVGR